MDMKLGQLTLAISLFGSATLVNAAPYTITNGNLVVNIRTDNGAIDDYILNGVDFFGWGTHVSDWGLQQGTDTSTFIRNTTDGATQQPVTVDQLSPTSVRVSGTYTGGTADVDFVRTLEIAPGTDVLLFTYSFTNNDLVNPVTIALFETFDPDQGQGTSCSSFYTYMDVVSAPPYTYGEAIDCTNLAFVLGSADPNITVSSGNPFSINSGSALNTFFSAPYDANGALLDSGMHMGVRVTLPPAGTVTYQGGGGASDAGASAAFAELTSAVSGYYVISSKNGVTTSESGTSESFNVTLGDAPTNDVTVMLSGVDASEGELSTSMLYFSPANWDVPQTITVTGVDDAFADGSVGYTIVASTSSADTNYDGKNYNLVSVSNSDNESADFVVSGTPFTTGEDGVNAEVTVNLTATSLAGTITVPVNISDSSEAVLSTSELVFDNSNLSQTITITGLDDAVADGDVHYQLQLGNAVTDNADDLGYAGMSFGSYNGVNIDDEEALINVDTSLSNATGYEGDSTSFTVALTSQPTDDVTIHFSLPYGVKATVTDSVTFTDANWMSPQNISLHRLNDEIDNEDQYYSVNYSIDSGDPVYSGLTIPVLDELTFVTLDDDVSGINVYDVTNTRGEEGDDTSFNLVLTSEPSSNVAIYFSLPDNVGATITDSITFTPTNWMSPQVITINRFEAEEEQRFAISYSVDSADPIYDGRSIITLDDLTLVNEEEDNTDPLNIIPSVNGGSTGGSGALNPLLLLAMGWLFAAIRRRETKLQ